jgi:hypothetical protein
VARARLGGSDARSKAGALHPASPPDASSSAPDPSPVVVRVR